MFNNLPLITIDRLIEHLNELKAMKLEGWQSSSVIGAVVVRKMDAATGITWRRVGWEELEDNTVGVILPIKEYEKMRTAMNALDTLFGAMDALGAFERFETK